MKKRLLAITLCVLMAVMLLPTPVLAADEAAIELGADGIGAGDEVYFGDYSVGGTTYDVPWIVLSDNVLYQTSVANGANVLPLLSEYTLGTSKFRSTAIDSGYYDANLALEANTESVLKATMDGLYNGTGTKLFSDLEQGAIVETTLQRDSIHLDKGNDLNTYLFPLSDDEIRLLGSNDSRKAADISDPATIVGWWVRYCSGRMVHFVGDNGDINVWGTNQMDAIHAVRPAFNLDLNKVLFTCSAVDGKKSGALGAGALNANIAPTGATDWKLTLLDSTRTFDVTNPTGRITTNTAGGDVAISYTGASYGTNEYLSAIIVDDSDNVLYYGRLKNIATATDASGIQSLTIPELPGGNYTLKIFNEQYNGDKNTDYSSAFEDFPLVIIEATVGDVTVSGITGSAITDTNVTITLINETFTDLNINENVSSWFNLPTNLYAKINSTVFAGDDTAIITIYGTPTATSTAAMAINIPYTALTRGITLPVTANANAKWNISAPVAPSITTQPTSQTIAEGQTATFTVSATGSPALSYKWEVSDGSSGWTEMSTATAASYTTSAATTDMSGYKYRCRVSNSVDSVTSNEVTLTVTANPPASGNTISGITAGGSYNTGDTVTFTVSGGGMNNTSPKADDKRWLPTTWETNPSGNFNSGYTRSFSTNGMSLGQHTLTVTFTQQSYNGTAWVNTGVTDTKTVSYTITTAAKTETAKTETAAPKTGDSTNIYLYGAMMPIASGGMIWLLTANRKKGKA